MIWAWNKEISRGRHARRWSGWTGAALVGAITLLGFRALPARGEIGRFDGYEIRVIRPRFMIKSNRLELGSEGAIIMNQSFIYTLLASGILDYHLSEMFAIEGYGAYGFSIDKEDKRILKQQFNINTQIVRTQYVFGAGMMWTPIYGKTQLPSGQVIYFDSFMTFTAGMTGINYNYEQCEPLENLPPPPAAQTKSYLNGVIGAGQQYYITQDWGIRWDVKDTITYYEKGDGSCTPDVPVGKDLHQGITVQMGASMFF